MSHQQQQEPRILLLPVSSLSTIAYDLLSREVSSVEEADNPPLASNVTPFPQNPVRQVKYSLNVPFKNASIPPPVLPPLSRRSRFGSTPQGMQLRPISRSTSASSFRLSLNSANPSATAAGSAIPIATPSTRRPPGRRPSTRLSSHINNRLGLGTESSLRPQSKRYTIKPEDFFTQTKEYGQLSIPSKPHSVASSTSRHAMVPVARPRSQMNTLNTSSNSAQQPTTPAPFKRISPATPSALMHKSPFEEEVKTDEEALSELRALVARIVEQTQSSSPNYGPTLAQRSRSARVREQPQSNAEPRSQLTGHSVADPNQAAPSGSIAISSASRSNLPNSTVSVQVHSSGSPQVLQTLSIGHQSATAASLQPQTRGSNSSAQTPLMTNAITHLNGAEHQQTSTTVNSTGIGRRSVLAQVSVQVALAPNSLLGPTLPGQVNGKLVIPPSQPQQHGAGPSHSTSAPNPNPGRSRVSELSRILTPLNGANYRLQPVHSLFVPAAAASGPGSAPSASGEKENPGARGTQSPRGVRAQPLAAILAQAISAASHSPDGIATSPQKSTSQGTSPAATKSSNGNPETSSPAGRRPDIVLVDVRSQTSTSSAALQQQESLRASAFRQPPPASVASAADAGAEEKAASPSTATTSISTAATSYSTTARSTPAALDTARQPSEAPARRTASQAAADTYADPEDNTAAAETRAPAATAPRDSFGRERERYTNADAALHSAATASAEPSRAALPLPLPMLVAKVPATPASGSSSSPPTAPNSTANKVTPASGASPLAALRPTPHASACSAAAVPAASGPISTQQQSPSKPETQTLSSHSTSTQPVSTPILATPASSVAKASAAEHEGDVADGDEDDEARFSDDEDAISAIGTDREDDVGTHNSHSPLLYSYNLKYYS